MFMETAPAAETDLEQGKEVGFRGRQGLTSQQLQQVAKIVATVESHPLDLQHTG